VVALEDLGHSLFDPGDESGDQFRGFLALRGEAVLDPGWDLRVCRAQHEAVAFQSPQGLGEHLLADPVDASSQFAEAVGALPQSTQREHAPAAGDVLQDEAGRTRAVIDVEP
jgi:hypothetical protein